VNARIGGNSPQVHQQQQARAQEGGVQRKDAKETKESKESKESKGAEGKGGVAGGGKAGGAKAKGATKGKNLGEVGQLLGGSDQWSVEDDEQQGRRRRRQSFFEEDMPAVPETPEDFDPTLGMLANIPAEFREQVASSLASARSFTRGGRSKNATGEEEPEVTGKTPVPLHKK
jgi:hypothetical protein